MIARRLAANLYQERELLYYYSDTHESVRYAPAAGYAIPR